MTNKAIIKKALELTSNKLDVNMVRFEETVSIDNSFNYLSLTIFYKDSDQEETNFTAYSFKSNLKELFKNLEIELHNLKK